MRDARARPIAAYRAEALNKGGAPANLKKLYHKTQKPIHKHQLLKSQLPSTKLQINLKLQYSMTKT
jgi:hypothetical protein